MKTEEMRQEMRAIGRELHELDRDKARLDWLDRHGLLIHLREGTTKGTIAAKIGFFRQAIDEAMKEEP